MDYDDLFVGNGAKIPLHSRDLTICICKATRENYPKGCMCEKSVSNSDILS